MEQAAVGSTERRRQALARLRQRQLRQQLCEDGAQWEFLPEVGETLGGFVLEARLGSGSYGTVYRARCGEAVYALKLLYLPHAAQWAQRELEVLLRLHRARLRRVECHGHYYHHPEAGPLFLYIVMDYVPGRPMDEYVERHNPAARWAARAVLALAGQLVVAHSVGVFHRDIKENNVVVEEDGRAVLVDYGVGTFPGALKVSAGKLPHTPLYRSPEAWRHPRGEFPGEDYEATAHDDLWALGVLLYWLLTGTWPFHGEGPEEVKAAVLDTQPVPPHERNPHVPRALSDVCQRMLQKAPEARYPDARAVCAALEAALAQADAGWEVALCEEWAPHNATTRWGPVSGRGAVEESLELMMARNRRLLAHEREHPRRGGPASTEFAGPGPWPLEDEPLLEETETVEPPAPVPPVPDAAVREAEASALPLTLGTGMKQEESAPVSRARPRTVHARWGGVLVLGAVALAVAVSSHTASSPVTAEPALTATPASWVAWVLSGQEVAPAWCPLEGGEGAAPAWAPTPAPVAFATLPEDSTRVRTPQKPQQKRGTVRTAVATALCTTAVGVAATGCPGAQVRATPAPESCPPGSLEAMRQLGIRTGKEAGAEFPGSDPQDFVTVQEGPGARLELGRPLGQLEAGTVLTGKFLFGKERVYGRLTQARRPNGDTFPVCLEVLGWGLEHSMVPGLEREAGSGPDTAKVTSVPHVKAVERFE